MVILIYGENMENKQEDKDLTLKTKQKFKLCLAGFSVFVCGLIVALVAVLGALNSNEKHNLKIAYSAENVCAEVTAGYVVSTINSSTPNDFKYLMLEAGGTEKIEFNSTSGSKPEVKAFDGMDVELKRDEFIYFKYTFSQTKVSANEQLIVDLVQDFDTFSNFKIEFLILNDATGSFAWQQEMQLIVLNCTQNPSTTVFIRLSVENKTQNAEFYGSFNWVLSGV